MRFRQALVENSQHGMMLITSTHTRTPMRRRLLSATALLAVSLSLLPVRFDRASAASSPSAEHRFSVYFRDDQAPADIARFEDTYSAFAVLPIRDRALVTFTTPSDLGPLLKRIRADEEVLAASEVASISRQQVVSVSPSRSSLTSAPVCAVSDGSSSATLTVAVRDASGSPLTGVPVSIAKTPSSTSAIVAPASVVSNASGIATFTTVDVTPETVTYSASAGGTALSQTALVQFYVGSHGCTLSAGPLTVSLPQNLSVQPGQTFTLPLLASRGTGIGAFALSVLYDPSKVTYLRTTNS